jgi:nicotinamidase-related amidase
MNTSPQPAALILIDLQTGFYDPVWGTPSNPACEANVGRLIARWTDRGWPIVVVQHSSSAEGSPLARDNPGHALMEQVSEIVADLHVDKRVNSAFHGSPSLDGWLRERGIDAIVLAGIQTNMCVETTARVGGNLGYRVVVPLDATRTFPLSAEVAGERIALSAEDLTRATAVNLAGGHFATVTTTDEALAG